MINLYCLADMQAAAGNLILGVIIVLLSSYLASLILSICYFVKQKKDLLILSILLSILDIIPIFFGIKLDPVWISIAAICTLFIKILLWVKKSSLNNFKK